MSAGRCSRESSNRTVGAARLACALAAAGALGAACSSSSGAPEIAAFALADCHGGLVEIARFPQTAVPTSLTTGVAFNDLALDGDTLYLIYAYASTESGLPISGGVLAVPVSGGPARVVGAADTATTSEWPGAFFWVSDGQVHLQSGTDIVSIPADAATPSALPLMFDTPYAAAYAHDAVFGYSALLDNGLTVAKTPVAGGAPIVIATDPLTPPSLGAMADAGDALLLHAGSYGAPAHSGEPGRLWRIPKDGTARSEPRPDVHWTDPVLEPMWLAWDGAAILGPTVVGAQNYLVQSRVAAAGTSAPVQLKLSGTIATRRNDEVLTLQTLHQNGDNIARLLVATSKGDPAGTVVACGPEINLTVASGAPSGIAATDTEIYLSYRDRYDTVIARVTP